MRPLPPGWAWTTLGEVATVLPGYGFPERLQGRRDGDIPFLKVRDISRAVAEDGVYAREADNYIMTRDCSELRARPMPAGTIVFAKIGEAIRLNRRAILAQDSLVDNNAMGALAASGLETLFLYYYLNTLKLGDLSRATTSPSSRHILRPSTSPSMTSLLTRTTLMSSRRTSSRSRWATRGLNCPNEPGAGEP